MAPQRGFRLAIDIGGSKVIYGLSRHNERLVATAQHPVTRVNGVVSVDEIVKRAREFVAEVLGDTTCLAGVGVAVPGHVDNGVIRVAANLGWAHVRLGDLLRDAFNAPVLIENDCTAAALAELNGPAVIGCDHLVYLSIGTGIGAGIIIDRQVYRGSTGRAGEVGHMILDPDGPACRCGSRGCFEAIASGRSLEARVRSLPGAESAPWGRLTATELLGFEEPPVGEVVRRWFDGLALGCVNLIRAFNPDRIVLGGGVGANLGPYIRQIQWRIGQLAPAIIEKEKALEISSFRNQASLIGADYLAAVCAGESTLSA